MARKQWRCFFCDEVFTRYQDAAEHFGCYDACEADVPACKIAAHEGHLVKYIRKLENELRRYMREDSDVMRSIAALEGEQAAAIREAEDRGYARGVADMKAQGHCPEPALHAA
jgi:hypothetical protein